MVVEAAVGDLRGFEEVPDICVGPPQNGINPHEGRPSSAAWTKFVLAASIRIAPATRRKNTSALIESCLTLDSFTRHDVKRCEMSSQAAWPKCCKCPARVTKQVDCCWSV